MRIYLNLTIFFVGSLVLTISNSGFGELRRLQIEASDLQKHVQKLASDEFEGRAPGTRGEELTVQYLVDKFKSYGLKPGNPDGTFIQKVPLIGSSFSDVEVSYKTGNGSKKLAYPGEVVIWTKQPVPQIKIDKSEIIFVGYGVVAPEYQWDDYKGVDVRGKTILMLVNDPPLPDPSDPSKLDERMFKGKAMTYYGRWTYKYEIAAEKGAAAAIIVHETGPAGYPWMVVVGSSSLEHFDLPAKEKRVAVEGWIPDSIARQLVSGAGKNFDDLKASASRRDFRPVSLNASFDYALNRKAREVQSKNVVARHMGNDRQLRNELVIYTAHWDHLGKNPKLEGDTIYNGARDNATGTAALLEIAHLFSRIGSSKRTILFLAVTAEEKGLLGARYYAQNPLYPLKQTVGNINMDSMNPWGRTHDVSVIGMGQSTLEDVLQNVAKGFRRRLSPDAEPEKGRYYRSDHFEFAKVGVPGLYIQAGSDFIGRPTGFGVEKTSEYISKDYHKVSDEIKPDWNLSGAAADARLLLEVGERVANNPEYPQWKEGSEFKKLR